MDQHNTFPKCPVCENGVRVLEYVNRFGRQQEKLVPCEVCNGTGILSFFKLKCIMQQIDAEGHLILECTPEEGEDTDG